MTEISPGAKRRATRALKRRYAGIYAQEMPLDAKPFNQLSGPEVLEWLERRARADIRRVRDTQGAQQSAGPKPGEARPPQAGTPILCESQKLKLRRLAKDLKLWLTTFNELSTPDYPLSLSSKASLTHFQASQLYYELLKLGK